jgi:aminodeoxyfutalosine deaminase
MERRIVQVSDSRQNLDVVNENAPTICTMVSSIRPRPFLISLPKAELHLHLEGSIEPPTLVELMQQHGSNGASPAEVERIYTYRDFAGFLLAFKNVTEHLRTPADYELITYRLMERLKSENVVHAEVYVSVGVNLWRKQDFPAIFEGLERGRQRGKKDFGVSLLWIFDAVRQFGAEKAARVLDLAIQFRERNVIGFGIGGDEVKGPPELFKDVYARAADQGLHRTVHAGESAGPESIWGALNLKAERIGHGFTAGKDPEIIEELSERQVPIEICITSNLRTGCCTDLSQHPVRRYFDQGLMLTLNSDDPAMFQTSLSAEYELAKEAFNFSDDHLRELARNSFEASFLPPEKKIEFLNLFDAATSRT